MFSFTIAEFVVICVGVAFVIILILFPSFRQQLIDQQGWKTMNLTGIEFADESVNKKSSTRRWICPKCKTIIRSTKEVRVTCTDCMEPFVKIDKANHCLKVKNRKAGDIA